MVHAILILKLYGLYGSKSLVYALSFLLFSTLTADIYIAATLLPRFDAIISVPGVPSICAGNAGPHFVLIWYVRRASCQGPADLSPSIPILVFDTCALGATLYKGVEQHRNGVLKRSRLMQVLLRDSLAYSVM